MVYTVYEHSEFRRDNIDKVIFWHQSKSPYSMRMQNQTDAQINDVHSFALHKTDRMCKNFKKKLLFSIRAADGWLVESLTWVIFFKKERKEVQITWFQLF